MPLLRIKNLLILISLGLIIQGCKKNNVGGNALVNGTVKHHTKSIANARIFVKFGSNNFPGADTNLYDHRFSADLNGNFSIQLYKGNYYFYAIGLDYAIAPPYTVKGGIPVILRSAEELTKTIGITE